jgi:capsular polysaccharide biosynthesis protein/Mrp family chromosome partitioning ATPase
MPTRHIGLLTLLQRWWSVMALATGAGGLVAYAYGTRITPTFEAEAQLVVEAPAVAGGGQEAAELVPTYAELVRSTAVLESSLRAAKSPLTPDELRSNVRGESERETRLITIRARDRDPAQAVLLANGLAAGLGRFVSVAPSRSPPGRQVRPRPRVRIVERATEATRIRPRSLLLIEFGALAGLFGALAVVLFVESRSRRVKDEDELVRLVPAGVLGSVNGGSVSPRLARSLVDRARTAPGEVESYRRLATRIAVANRDEVPQSLLVVGAQATDGSGLVAAKLALALAGEERRVVLADFAGDGRIARLFGIGKRKDPGALVRRSKPLSHGGVILDRFRPRSGRPLLLAMPRGSGPHTLSVAEARALVALLSAQADVLIVHGPSPNRSRGALTWARAAAATVLVVRSEHTRRENVVRALEGLEPLGTNVVGAILRTGRI